MMSGDDDDDGDDADAGGGGGEDVPALAKFTEVGRRKEKPLFPTLGEEEEGGTLGGGGGADGGTGRFMGARICGDVLLLAVAAAIAATWLLALDPRLDLFGDMERGIFAVTVGSCGGGEDELLLLLVLLLFELVSVRFGKRERPAGWAGTVAAIMAMIPMLG